MIPDGFKDFIITEIDLKLGWKDRLKLLFSGSIKITNEIFTENEIGKVSQEEVKLEVKL